MEQVHSPALIVGSESRIEEYFGSSHVRIAFDVKTVRLHTSKLLSLGQVDYWTVFDLPEDIQMQGMFLKFLEEYSGNVAFYTPHSMYLLPPFASRLVSIIRSTKLYRFSFGKGVQPSERLNVHDAATPLVFRKVYETGGRASFYQQRILQLLDSIG